MDVILFWYDFKNKKERWMDRNRLPKEFVNIVNEDILIGIYSSVNIFSSLISF